MELLESAKSGKRRDGQVVLIKHLNGIRLTQRQAIRAKCYDCDGMGDTGVCELVECPLYPFSTYKVAQA
jgi:hypothetical protein